MLNKARDSALPANVIAKKVEDIVSSNNPKIRYTVAAFKHKLMSKMPKKLLDKIFAYFLISKNWAGLFLFCELNFHDFFTNYG